MKMFKKIKTFGRVCEVVDYKGNYCPDRPIHRIVYKGKECFLCKRCYQLFSIGAFK